MRGGRPTLGRVSLRVCRHEANSLSGLLDSSRAGDPPPFPGPIHDISFLPCCSPPYSVASCPILRKEGSHGTADAEEEPLPDRAARGAHCPVERQLPAWAVPLR